MKEKGVGEIQHPFLDSFSRSLNLLLEHNPDTTTFKFSILNISKDQSYGALSERKGKKDFPHNWRKEYLFVSKSKSGG